MEYQRIQLWVGCQRSNAQEHHKVITAGKLRVQSAGQVGRCTRELALAYDAMQGYDPDDAGCADRPAEPSLPSLAHGIEGLRIPVAGGYFAPGGDMGALRALRVAADALGANPAVDIPDAAPARLPPISASSDRPTPWKPAAERPRMATHASRITQ